jgi:phage terminase small subunit
MAKTGKKSAAELSTPMIPGGPEPLLQPPPTLSEPARAVFIRLVTDCGPDHFIDSDITLLEQYCEATATARMTAGKPDQVRIWETAVRTMSGLALRLRLGPQSRRERAKVERRMDWSENFARQHGWRPDGR